MTTADQTALDRELDMITNLEWRELRLRFGDLCIERPELAPSLVDIVRRERVH